MSSNDAAQIWRNQTGGERRDRRPALMLMGALLASAAPVGAWAQQAAAAAPATLSVQEIVVTAEKRAATVQTTPISMTALSGSQLQSQGVTDLQGIIKDVPGISMRTAGPGQTELEMRGLASSGGSSPTVGFYLDEVPLSPPAASLNGKVVIDPDLYDLNRVEVLRGPQGTLYGSGSMGGTIKLVTNEPNLNDYAASFDATLSGTEGGGVNKGGDLMVNIPLAQEKAALRIVGTEKYTDGWIDRIVGGADFPLETNPSCGAFYGCTRGDVTTASVTKTYKNVNSSLLGGARASLLIQPTSALSLEGSVMYQRTTANGYAEYDDLNGASGKLAHYQPFDLKEPFSDTFKLASGVIKYDFGPVQVTSSTSYWTRVEQQTMDATELVQNLLAMNYYSPISFTERDESHQFSEELRAASKGSGRFQWVGGVFYSTLTSAWIDTNKAPAYAPLSVGGAAANPDGIVYASNNPYHMDQYAVFGEASYKLPYALKATVGLRYYQFNTHVDMFQNGIGTASGNADPTISHVSTKASGFNPRFNLSYIPNGDLTVYATVAKGFRPGGVSLPGPPQTCGDQPVTYGPDSVWSYEAGEKARLFNGRLSVNGDVYLMQWKGVQQSITPPCGYPYTTNAGDARAYGPELEVVGRLTHDLTATFNGTYTSAKLTSAAAGTGLVSGQPILNIPDYTFSLSLTYSHPLTDRIDLVARVGDNYVGQSYDVAYTVRKLPSYNLVDARLTFNRGAQSLTLFATNLSNERAELTVNNTAFAWLTPSLTRISTNQPRTFGVTVSGKF